MELNGKILAEGMCDALRVRCNELKKRGVIPKLKIVTTGDNKAGQVYVRNKVRKAKEIGIEVVEKHFDSLTQDEADKTFFENMLPTIYQLPITGDVDLKRLILCHAPGFAILDVDGFLSPYNTSVLFSGGKPDQLPCTPAGIIELLDAYDIDPAEKCVCIIGRSNIVGRPLAAMFEHRNATVILCHSKTPIGTLINSVRMADIIVSATGYYGTLSERLLYDYGVDISEKVLVDVGINRDESGRLRGDIDPALYKQAYAYTPVPGGVGPMTVAMLMSNVIECYERMCRDVKG